MRQRILPQDQGRRRSCRGPRSQGWPPRGGRAESWLAALMRAAGDRFRGIRNAAAWDADTPLLNPANPAPPGLLGDKTFREGFAVLGRLGLSFDALVLHPQLNDVANLAGA